MRILLIAAAFITCLCSLPQAAFASDDCITIGETSQNPATFCIPSNTAHQPGNWDFDDEEREWIEKPWADENNKGANYGFKFDDDDGQWVKDPRLYSPPRNQPAAPPAYTPPRRDDSVANNEIIFTYKNDALRRVQLSFYSQNRNFYWPGGNLAYNMAMGEERTFRLGCQPGEQICMGAWDTDTTKIFWGVGLRQNRRCADCCGTCGHRYQPRRFVYEGPEPSIFQDRPRSANTPDAPNQNLNEAMEFAGIVLGVTAGMVSSTRAPVRPPQYPQQHPQGFNRPNSGISR